MHHGRMFGYVTWDLKLASGMEFFVTVSDRIIDS